MNPRRACLLFSLLTVIPTALEGTDRDWIVFSAESLESGLVRLHARGFDGEHGVDGNLALAAWQAFRLRESGELRPASGSWPRETGSPFPRIQLGSRGSLIAYRDADTSVSGLAFLGLGGLSVLKSGTGDHYRPLASSLAPSGRNIAILVRGDARPSILLVDLLPAIPTTREVELPSFVEDVDEESLSLTADAVFAIVRDGSGDRHLIRAARGDLAPDAESIAGPFRRFGEGLAVSPRAVAFLAGENQDEMDVWVAPGDSPAINLTRLPGAYVEHRAGRQSIAISTDGSTVAYSVDVDREPETFLHAVDRPGIDGRLHITRDAHFNPYIDQEIWIFFGEQGDLFFTGGHSPETTEFFCVPGSQTNEPLNLTRTGVEATLHSPFLRKGTLDVVKTWELSPDVLVVDAVGFEPGLRGVRVVDTGTGATLLELPRTETSSRPLRLGSVSYLTLHDAAGYRLVGLQDDGSALSDPLSVAVAEPPRLLLASEDRALYSLPGAGLLTLSTDSASIHIEDGTIEPSATATPDGRVVLARRELDGTRRYITFDPSSGDLEDLFAASDSPSIATEIVGLSGPPSSTGLFVRGDANHDGRLDISDPILTLVYLFAGEGSEPHCLDAADTNDDGALDITDPIRSLLHLFQGAAPPPAPYPALGPDPTSDALDC